MKVQEEDKEIALIEQSYDAGEENSTYANNVLSKSFQVVCLDLGLSCWVSRV